MSDKPEPKRQSGSLKPAIAKAILDCRKQVEKIICDEFNEADKYAYPSIDLYYEKVVPIASDLGLFWTARLTNARKFDDENIIVDVEIDLKFVDGTVYVAYDEFPLLNPVNGPQTAGHLKSYADKVFIRSAFAVATGEGDADQHSSRRKAPTKLRTISTEVQEDMHPLEASLRKALPAAYTKKYLDTWWSNNAAKLKKLENGSDADRKLHRRLVDLCQKRSSEIAINRRNGGQINGNAAA